jgi:hypothetical protein
MGWVTPQARGARQNDRESPGFYRRKSLNLSQNVADEQGSRGWKLFLFLRQELQNADRAAF